MPVPKGFTASEATGEKNVNEGFVIYEGEEVVNDSNVEEARKNRNQFVWIPVDNNSLREMYNTNSPRTVLSKSSLGEEETITYVYSNLRVREEDKNIYIQGIPGDNSYIREPDILTYTNGGDATTGDITTGIEQIKSVFELEGSNAEVLKQYAQMIVDEYTSTYESIKKYDGFYVGRYELTGTVDKPTVQKNKEILTASSTQAVNWYVLKEACTSMVNTNAAQSTMIYGNQWDEVMDWLIQTGAKTSSEVNSNSSNWGNYNDYNTANEYVEGNPLYVDRAGLYCESGYSENWKANNIYDLAGNHYERTQEAIYTNIRIRRGGNYTNEGVNNPASERADNLPGYSNVLDSTRPVLYIK